MHQETVIHHDRPAGADWNRAYPIGCGRLGAMVFGNVEAERLQLNEDSVWSGGPRDRTNPDARRHLQEIRDLLLDGHPRAAEQLVQDAIAGIPDIMRNYEPLADLLLQFDYGQPRAAMPERPPGYDEHFPAAAATGEAAATDYRRELDLADGVTRVSFRVDGVIYRREVFASYPDQAVVMQLTADRPGAISLRLRLERGPRDNYASRYADSIRPESPSSLHLRGATGGEQPIRFAGHLEVTAVGAAPRSCGETLIVEHADRVTLVFAAATSYRETDPGETARNTARRASARGFDALLATHLVDYRALFGRTRLTLGNGASAAAKLPLDRRLEAFAGDGFDLGLAELYFNFGRYLLIASSRPGSLPANLQGLWNQDFMPAWGAKYTVNINTQMNYWPAEVGNLAECHLPLFDLLLAMLPQGRRVAQEMYGCRGFVCHHNTDLWGDCCPVDRNLAASYWPTGGAWLALHIWEHYRFAPDREFLRKYYAVIREAALFLVDFMIENANGKLITCPTVSPENTYILPDGEFGTLSAGTAMDAAIAAELFAAFEGAAAALGEDRELRDRVADAAAKLPRCAIGRHGQLLEWLEDYEEMEPGHRHISHLFALHPGRLIHPEATPDLAAAAARTLELRLGNGGGHTGWSRAWIINFFARLHQGEKAWENLGALFTHSTLPNLFDNHPPFQIDGNFGGAAGIAEMLIQSHLDRIELLPALPAAWSCGDVRGIRARGGFELDFAWSEQRLTSCAITAPAGGTATVTWAGKTVTCNLAAGEKRMLDFT